MIPSQSIDGRLRVLLESVELRDTVDRAVESVPTTIGQDAGCGRAPGDAGEGRRVSPRGVFSNLLDNAYRYGGSRIRLQALRDEGDRVLVTLTDDGDGIPEELVPALFDRLSRGANASETRGLGRLAIA